MSAAKRSKRSKPDDAELDKSSYACFAAAANAVAQLYTAGVRERRATTKATLVSTRSAPGTRAVLCILRSAAFPCVCARGVCTCAP